MTSQRDNQAKAVSSEVILPPGIIIRAWTGSDFTAIQRLSNAAGWPTPQDRPAEASEAWRRSWPALVATHSAEVIGFLRALSDGAVTTYVCEILVDPAWRGQGIGRALIETCHHLCPSTRLDLLSGGTADGGPRFYEANGFRRFQGFRRSCC